MVRLLWILGSCSPHSVEARVTGEVLSRLKRTGAFEIQALACQSSRKGSVPKVLGIEVGRIAPGPEGPARLRQFGQSFSPGVMVTLGEASRIVPDLETTGGRKVPWIGSIPLEGQPLPPFWRGLSQSMEATVCFSQSACKTLKARGIDARHLPLGVDTQAFRERRNGPALRTDNGLEGRFVVGCLLEGSYQERLGPLVNVFEKLARLHAETSFCLYVPNCQQKAQEQLSCLLTQANLPSEAVTLRLMNHRTGVRNRAEAYHLCDVLVFAEGAEESILTLLEAMACGIPTIAPEGSAAADLLMDQGERVRARKRRADPPGIAIDPDHLVELLARLCHNPELRAEQGRRARELAQTMTWERCATEWNLVIGEALRSSHRDSSPAKSGERVLLHREIGLGDVLMSFVAARAFKESNPDNRVTFSTAPRFVEFVKHCPMVDEVVTPEQVRRGRFAHKFDFDGRESFDFAPGWQHRERIDLILDIIGLPVSDKKPCYRVDPEESARAHDLLTQRGCRPHDELIGMVLSAAVPPRSPSPEVTATWVRKLLQHRPRTRVVLLDNDAAISRQLGFSALESRRIVDLSGQLSLVELAAVVEQLDLVITPDTGVLHLAGALRVPLIGFFNEVHPYTRIGYYENAVGKAKTALCRQWPCEDPGCCKIDLCCINQLTYADFHGDIEWLLTRGRRYRSGEWRLPFRAPSPTFPLPARHRSRVFHPEEPEVLETPNSLLPLAPDLRLRVWQHSRGLRELLCALSVAEAMRRARPRSHITFHVAPEHAALVNLFPWVDSVTTQELTSQGQYLELDLDDLSLETSVEWETQMGLRVGVQVERLALPPKLPESVMQSAKEWLQGYASFERVIAFAPFAGGRSLPRSWAEEQVFEFMDQAPLDHLIVLLDEQPFEAPVRENLLNVSGQTDLMEAWAVLARCDVFVGADTALLDAAALHRLPVVGLFTHTNPIDRLGLVENYVALQPSLPCAPCGELASDCPHPYVPRRHACGETLTAHHVLAQLDRISKDNPRREIVSLDLQGNSSRWDLTGVAGHSRLQHLTAIIVVNRNQWVECTRECIYRALQTTLPPCEVLLVDDGSSAAELKKIEAELPAAVRLLRNAETKGNPIACNLGLKQVSPEARLVCILKSDCFIQEWGWNRKVMRRFEENGGLGAVCPTLHERRFFLDGRTGDDYFYDPYGDEFDCEMINGSCLVFDRSRTGDLRFDESFSPGGREDDDLSFQIRSQGWSLGQLTDCRVMSLRLPGDLPEGQELHRRNRERLTNKWRTMLHPRSGYVRDCLFIRSFYKTDC